MPLPAPAPLLEPPDAASGRSGMVVMPGVALGGLLPGRPLLGGDGSRLPSLPENTHASRPLLCCAVRSAAPLVPPAGGELSVGLARGRLDRTSAVVPVRRPLELLRRSCRAARVAAADAEGDGGGWAPCCRGERRPPPPPPPFPMFVSVSSVAMDRPSGSPVETEVPGVAPVKMPADAMPAKAGAGNPEPGAEPDRAAGKASEPGDRGVAEASSELRRRCSPVPNTAASSPGCGRRIRFRSVPR